MARYVLSLSLLAALGCTATMVTPEVDLDAERQALMQADAAWFASHEKIDEFVSFLADDAIFMPSGAPLARGADIRASWEELLSLPGFGLEWRPASAHVAQAGDLGYTVGTYELTVRPEGAAVVTVGKYVTLWKKQADGSWKVAVDCFNADSPPPGA